MREFLEDLARALVSDPDAVEVEEFTEDDGTVVLELSLGEASFAVPLDEVRTLWLELLARTA